MIRPHRRIIALIIKEIATLLQDPKGRLVLIGPPLLQLLIFSFAATLEVKNIELVIFNEDMGKHGHELVRRLNGSPEFTNLHFVSRLSDIQPYIDQQKAIAAVHIPPDFSRCLESGRQSPLQVILDGRRSNAAQIASGYLAQIANEYGAELLETRSTQNLPIRIDGRNWFNENLLYRWFTVPSLIGILSMIIAIIVTALSVARERELGTFDQLLVSPLMPHEILIGKTVPAVLISMAEGLLIWTAGVVVFQIPFTGSFLLLIFAMFFFITSVVGVGLFISSLSKNQQQAILGAFVFLVPATTLSGYAAPIENMPLWLQRLTWLNPLKHVLITIKGLFLKDMPFAEVWSHTWPLLVIGTITLGLAGWFFSRRLE